MTPSNAKDDAVEAVALKPCPFCGGKAKRHTIGDDEPNNVGGDVICCTVCQASSHVEFGRKENLVDRWNTRAAIEAMPITAKLVECICVSSARHQANCPAGWEKKA